MWWSYIYNMRIVDNGTLCQQISPQQILQRSVWAAPHTSLYILGHPCTNLKDQTRNKDVLSKVITKYDVISKCRFFLTCQSRIKVLVLHNLKGALTSNYAELVDIKVLSYGLLHVASAVTEVAVVVLRHTFDKHALKTR